MKSKQTAVEWLCNEWLYIDHEFDMKLIDKKTYWEKLKSVQDQANAMFEEQIKNSYHSGTIDGFNFRTTSISPNPEQYYNETFKSH